MTPGISASAGVDTVAHELERLMRRKKRDLIDPEEFRSVVGAARVTSRAGALGLSLLSGEELRAVLRSLLEELRAAEEATNASNLQEGVEADRPTAAPGLKLLGLVPTTENKGIGQRLSVSATSRKVKPGSMRRHAQLIANEIAVFLTSCPEDDRAKSGDRSRASVVANLRRQTKLVSQRSFADGELLDLIEALALTYDDFFTELAHLVAHKDSYPRIITGLARSENCKALQALASRDFDSTPKLSLALLGPAMALAGPPFDTRTCLLARLIALIDHCQPDFSEPEQDILRFAARESRGEVNRFLTLVEGSNAGREALDKWMVWLYGNVYPDMAAGDIVIHSHCGYIYVRELLAGEPRDRRNVDSFLVAGDDLWGWGRKRRRR